MADLNAILSQYGPNSVLGGAMAGMAFSDYSKAQEAERQKASLEMALKQAEEARKVDEHPLNLEGKRATIGQTNAQARDFNAQAGGRELANIATAATQPGAIAATNAKNQGTVSEEQAKNAERLYQATGQLSSVNWGALGPNAFAQLQQALQERGIPPMTGVYAQTFQNTPPTQWRALLKHMNDTANQTTAAYQKAQMEKEASIKVGAGHDAATIRAAEIAAKSRTDVAEARKADTSLLSEVREATKKAAGDPLKTWTIYRAAKIKAAQQNNPELADHFQQLEDELKPAAETALRAGKPGGQAVVQDGKIENITPSLPGSGSQKGSKDTPAKKPLSAY